MIKNIINKKDYILQTDIVFFGAPRGIRTPDAWIRSPALYPTEL